MEIIRRGITHLFTDAVKKIMTEGVVRYPRSLKCKEVIGASLKLLNPRSRVLQIIPQIQSVNYIADELKWYLSGDYNIDKISKSASIWKGFADENHNVRSNYGAKLFHYKVSDLTQFQHVIVELEKDPDSRRAIFFINLLPEDYRLMHTGKDFPCNTTGQAIIVNNQLSMIVTQRSCDAIHGLTNDIPFFSFLQEMFATKLELELGTLHYNYGSLHIYEDYFDFVNKMKITNGDEKVFEKMTTDDVDALINQNYKGKTPFMKSLNNYGRLKW